MLVYSKMNYHTSRNPKRYINYILKNSKKYQIYKCRIYIYIHKYS